MNLSKPTIRSYVPETDRITSLLETDQPLPDDDPSTSNGGLKPNRKADEDQIKMYIALRTSGAISDKAWQRLIARNPASAALFSSVGPDQSISIAKNRADIGNQYFNPGQAAVPFQTTEEQAFGMPSLNEQNAAQGYGPNIAKEAVAPKQDVNGAILAALQRGDTEYATKIAEVAAKSGMTPNPKNGLYGGIQYALDPKTKTYVAYSVDESTRKAVPISPPEGTLATIPVSVQPGIGPNGPGMFQVPTRAPGGNQANNIPGISPMPTSEEVTKSAQSATAQDMAQRLKSYLDQKKFSVGPVNGRMLSAKATTGIGLSPEEADAFSIQEQLSNLVLQAMRGAQVGPLEQERFNKQLPRAEQPEGVFRANIDNTLRNLAQMQRMISAQRPVKPAQQDQPQKTTSNKRIKFSDLP